MYIYTYDCEFIYMYTYIYICEHTYTTLIAMDPYALTRSTRTLLLPAFTCALVGVCRGCVPHDL